MMKKGYEVELIEEDQSRLAGEGSRGKHKFRYTVRGECRSCSDPSFLVDIALNSKDNSMIPI